MKEFNEMEWKNLQEKVKKIDEEGSQKLIGVHFFIAEFNISLKNNV